MMKKIERAAYFLKENMQLFRCPLCKSDFKQVNNNQIMCLNNHSFNISKKGTVHFLNNTPTDQYDKDLFESRKKIADSGFWTPILEEVYSHMPKDSGSILDVGCGNGSNLNKIHKSLPESICIGFDISKQGIEMAAKYYWDIFWCVADLADTPFSDQSFDIILNIFTPSNYQEFGRIIKPYGTVMKVVPNPGYLQEIRSLKDDKHNYSNENVIQSFKEHFNEVKIHDISYKKYIPKHLIHDLLRMTPLGWRIDEKKKAQYINDGDQFRVTIDVTLLIGR